MSKGLISFLITIVLIVLLCIGITASVVESNLKKETATAYFEGYKQPYIQMFGTDIGTLVAECKFQKGEPVVNSGRVACIKELKSD